MIKYSAVLLLLVVFCASQCAAKCSTTSRTDASCDSFKAFHDSNRNQRKSWTSVTFQSTVKGRIFENILATIPNIQNIGFNGIANDIADFTFASRSKLSKITFDNCDLPIIRKNWFVFHSNAPVDLTIKNSKVELLEPNCLDMSVNLFSFKLQDNKLAKINSNVFNGTLITKLSFTNNRINYIDENAFDDMIRLEEIFLNVNFLKSFNAKLYLNNVPKLLRLSLTVNKLEYVNFESLSKLQYLNFLGNKIQTFQDDLFKDLNDLEILVFNNNSLSYFPDRAFPYNGLPSLKILGIATNRFTYLPKHFLLMFPKLETIDVFENPWQCACYKDFMKAISYTSIQIRCGIEHATGERPVCVVPRIGGDKCDENLPDENELYTTYMEGLEENQIETLFHCIH